MTTTHTTLSQYLHKRSGEICRDNGCTEENHKCLSYAYIRHDMQLLDICCSDYFQGCSKPHAAILLPWMGDQWELEAEVAYQCADFVD